MKIKLIERALKTLRNYDMLKSGDVVEIISADPSAPHSVENLARLAGTIPYEVTVRLGNRVKRVLVD